jgi:hypothetical protein
MTEIIGSSKVLKVFPSFILGKCRCGCGKDVPIRTKRRTLGKYISGHHRIDYSKRKSPIREKHWKWNGGKMMAGTKRKYVAIRRKHHPFRDPLGYVFEHRYRMELMLGRYLTEEEVVHHIDGDKKNNEESNLMLFANNTEHMKYERDEKMKGRICKKCGSNKTRVRSTRGRKYLEWWGNKINGFICYRCHYNLINPKVRMLSYMEFLNIYGL